MYYIDRTYPYPRTTEVCEAENYRIVPYKSIRRPADVLYIGSWDEREGILLRGRGEYLGLRDTTVEPCGRRYTPALQLAYKLIYTT
jgi:hypothetical protein